MSDSTSCRSFASSKQSLDLKLLFPATFFFILLLFLVYCINWKKSHDENNAFSHFHITGFESSPCTKPLSFVTLNMDNIAYLAYICVAACRERWATYKIWFSNSGNTSFAGLCLTFSRLQSLSFKYVVVYHPKNCGC